MTLVHKVQNSAAGIFLSIPKKVHRELTQGGPPMRGFLILTLSQLVILLWNTTKQSCFAALHHSVLCTLVCVGTTVTLKTTGGRVYITIFMLWSPYAERLNPLWRMSHHSTLPLSIFHFSAPCTISPPIRSWTRMVAENSGAQLNQLQ